MCLTLGKSLSQQGTYRDWVEVLLDLTPRHNIDMLHHQITLLPVNFQRKRPKDMSIHEHLCTYMCVL
jgi:hypothetical protein